MKKIFFLIFAIIFLSGVLASCNSGQIDINSASLSELDKITGVWPATAQKIIDGRSYNSLDDLLNVKGIGNKTLEKIKSQNLACVASGEKTSEVLENSHKETSSHLDAEIVSEEEVVQIPKEQENSLLFVADVVQNESIINLNQEVKIEQNKQTVFESKTEKIRKYSIYGFAFFLIFLIIVLLIKN